MTLGPLTPLTSLAKPTFLNPNPITTKTVISSTLFHVFKTYQAKQKQ
jgi:hypothetical protein